MRLLPLGIALLLATVAATGAAPAFADDGYDTPLAVSVRAATQHLRLALWAPTAGYVQATDYVEGYGTTFMSRQGFGPPDLAHPTTLVYDIAGRLVACGYHFAVGAPLPDALRNVPKSAWYDIPEHAHYNVLVDGVVHFGQTAWNGDAAPTSQELIARHLVPANAKLLTAFVHPATRAVLVWAWRPNPDGLFESDNRDLM